MPIKARVILPKFFMRLKTFCNKTSSINQSSVITISTAAMTTTSHFPRCLSPLCLLSNYLSSILLFIKLSIILLPIPTILYSSQFLFSFFSELRLDIIQHTIHHFIDNSYDNSFILSCLFIMLFAIILPIVALLIAHHTYQYHTGHHCIVYHHAFHLNKGHHYVRGHPSRYPLLYCPSSLCLSVITPH